VPSQVAAFDRARSPGQNREDFSDQGAPTMAKVFITRHTVEARKWPRLSSGQALGALGGQDGDALDLELGANETHTAPAQSAALYRIMIDGADARVRIGKDAEASETGERWLDGSCETRYLMSGERISVVVAD
jgi:hypothetical protein